MVRKGNLTDFESSNISETKEAMPTKLGVHEFDINPYLHKFFELILFDSIFYIEVCVCVCVCIMYLFFLFDKVF